MDDVGPLHPLETARRPEAFTAPPGLVEAHADILIPCLETLQVEPLCAYAWTGKPGWQLEPRTVADSMWFYFSTGRGRVGVGESAGMRVFDFRPGSLILIPAGTRHWITLNRGLSMAMHTVHFHARVLEGFEALHYLGFPPHWSVSDPQRMELLCERLAREHALCPPGCRRYMEAEIAAVLLGLVREHPVRLCPRFQGFGHSSFGRLREFMHWAEHNLSNPQAGIDNAAREIGVSDSYLRRVFRVNLGLGPRRYLLNRRLEHALVLLRTTPLAVADIASACGFSDPPYFYRAFRRRYRSTPTAYRKTLNFPQHA